MRSSDGNEEAPGSPAAGGERSNCAYTAKSLKLAEKAEDASPVAAAQIFRINSEQAIEEVSNPICSAAASFSPPLQEQQETDKIYCEGLHAQCTQMSLTPRQPFESGGLMNPSSPPGLSVPAESCSVQTPATTIACNQAATCSDVVVRHDSSSLMSPVAAAASAATTAAEGRLQTEVKSLCHDESLSPCSLQRSPAAQLPKEQQQQQVQQQQQQQQMQMPTQAELGGDSLSASGGLPAAVTGGAIADAEGSSSSSSSLQWLTAAVQEERGTRQGERGSELEEETDETDTSGLLLRGPQETQTKERVKRDSDENKVKAEEHIRDRQQRQGEANGHEAHEPTSPGRIRQHMEELEADGEASAADAAEADAGAQDAAIADAAAAAVGDAKESGGERDVLVLLEGEKQQQGVGSRWTIERDSGDSRAARVFREDAETETRGKSIEQERRREVGASSTLLDSESIWHRRTQPEKEQENPWEVPYEVFVRRRMLAKRHSAAEEAVQATQLASVLERYEHKGEAKASACTGGGDEFPLEASHIGALHAQPSEDQPRRGPPEWKAPSVLPSGCDLVTYVQLRDGEQQEHHALHCRDTRTLERGPLNFSDVFAFIRWVHDAQDGSPCSLPADVASSSRKKSSRQATTETKQTQAPPPPQRQPVCAFPRPDAEVDTFFDPNEPPQEGPLGNLQFTDTTQDPWADTAAAAEQQGPPTAAGVPAEEYTGPEKGGQRGGEKDVDSPFNNLAAEHASARKQ